MEDWCWACGLQTVFFCVNYCALVFNAIFIQIIAQIIVQKLKNVKYMCMLMISIPLTFPDSHLENITSNISLQKIYFSKYYIKKFYIFCASILWCMHNLEMHIGEHVALYPIPVIYICNFNLNSIFFFLSNVRIYYITVTLKFCSVQGLYFYIHS